MLEASEFLRFDSSAKGLFNQRAEGAETVADGVAEGHFGLVCCFVVGCCSRLVV